MVSLQYFRLIMYQNRMHASPFPAENICNGIISDHITNIRLLCSFYSVLKDLSPGFFISNIGRDQTTGKEFV